MVTIGNDTLPGPITTLESAASSGANLGAPGTPIIAGQAYLSEGNADANDVLRITRPRTAAEHFGPASKSQLTVAIQDAIVAGAYPVYAVAPEEVEVTGEDLSGKSGQTGTLANAPVIQHPEDITFTVNSTTKDTVIYLDGDPANASVGDDEVYLNPQTGKYRVDESQGNSGDDVDYTYADFADTFNAIQNQSVADEPVRGLVDFVATVDERDSVSNSLENTVDSLESNGFYTIGIAGAGDPYIDDEATEVTDEIDNYSNSFDNSRMQVIHPSRKGDNNTAIGAYVGKRSSLGLSTTPISKFINSLDQLRINVSRNQQEKLVNARVIPLEERSGGAKIIEDNTTVSEGNTEEAMWKQGISRLITDYVAESVEAATSNYVGEFNDQATLNNVRSSVSGELKPLLEARQLEAYSLVVEEVDAMTAAVDIGIDTADPLRNIELNISAGAVENGVQVN